ncbi:LysM peptidoglycan-binding domain-containing protein [Actinopolymorpha rutila]|uniref:Nucleoid-associated protein YgaU n=1 Tax=Actinopolymorpha rutila TaxID=446787 RepID=A0A852ZJN4_9ACTN|nr:LysM peptidoglycan-binding domain-containing protein [Actinopolymorpha rutila]NYH92453.1 nucleoid-associated protein YgaU [Actinopolymorpha rutila]
MGQELAKAVVTLLGGRNSGRAIEVLFNPTEYSVEYSATFQEAAPPGLSSPIIQFVNGNAQVLTMDLLFDTYTDGGGADVTATTRPFLDMVAIDGDLHAPPPVEFRWGSFAFRAVVSKITQKLTMFRSDGIPVRATLSVTFKQYKTIAEQLEDPRRNSADKTKRRVFEAHDSIWLLAAREYGEVRYWRLIAKENDIDDPRRIEAGRVLVLPPIDRADPKEAADADRGA